MKFQDLISAMELESHKNIVPINFDKFFKITATLLYFMYQNYTLDVLYLSYFLYLEFWYNSIFYVFVTL